MAWIACADKRRLLDGQRRAVVGSSQNCDLRLEGKAIAHRHLKVSAQPDGRLLLLPIAGASYRINGVREHQARFVAPGTTIGIGLLELHTGSTPKRFIHDLVFAWDDGKTSLRELRAKLPWISASLLVHLLLLFLFLHKPATLLEGRSSVELGFALDAGSEDAPQTDDSEELEEREEYPPDEAPETSLPDPAIEDDNTALDDPAELDGTLSGAFGGELDADMIAALSHKLKRLGDKPGPGDATKRGSEGSSFAPPIPKNLSKGFAKTVAHLRRSGLEIVFCFDSTGSMGPILDEAKQDLLELFHLVQELVPRTRMGIITYRDKGDSYVTRSTRLGIGPMEALAFLSSVQADGGGDYPEAVDEALMLASKLPWRPGARKVTILVGDAPPHPERLRRAVGVAQRLSRRNGQVHVLVCGHHAQTRDLQRIALAGGGRYLPRSKRYQLSLQLLTFALGPDSSRDLERLLMQRSERRRRSWGTRIQTKSILPDARILAATLAKTSPDPVIVEAWTWAQLRDIRSLSKLFAKRKLSVEGLLGLYYICNRVLERNGFSQRLDPPRLPLARKGLPFALRHGLQTVLKR